MVVKDLLESGKLQDAITASIEVVRSQPFNLDERGLLVELFILDGQLERADKQLDVIAHQHPEAMPGVSLLRQLIRAEISRSQFFIEGRVPEFLDLPSEVSRKLLELSVSCRAGDVIAASTINEATENIRTHSAGSCNGQKFRDFRDLDDRTSSIMEILTSNGKYYWISLDEIKRIEFRALERPIDYKWRRAYIETKNESIEGEVYIPGIYFSEEKDDMTCLGRLTDWVTEKGNVCRGLGQKMYMAGEHAIAISEIKELVFENV